MSQSKAELKYDWKVRRVYINLDAYYPDVPPSKHLHIMTQMNRRIQENEWKWDSFQERLK